MKIYCYWKKDSSSLENIAEKLYDICYNIYRNLGYADWMIYLKKQWSFNISSLSKSEFCETLVQGVLQEDKNRLKRLGYSASPEVKISTGFTISLFLKLRAKEYVSFTCSMGIESEHLINSCIVTFPKGEFDFRNFFYTVISVLNPQWATLTENVLICDIAEFSKDMIPGYLMFFRSIDKKSLSDLPIEMLQYSSDGLFLTLNDKIEFSETARQKAALISSSFKKAGVNFTSLLI